MNTINTCHGPLHKVVVDTVPSAKPDRWTDDDEITIFSAEWEDEESVESSTHFHRHEQWALLQKRFLDRNTMLERISRTKPQLLVKSLWRREMIVRRQLTERFLLEHLDGADETWNGDSWASSQRDDDESLSDCEADVWYDACEEMPNHAPFIVADNQRGADEEPGFLQRFCETALFECCITVPSVVVFALHSLVHASMYDVIEIVAEAARLYWQEYGAIASLAIHALIFCLGFSFMRASGFLYWWLNSDDYNCIKFEFHNRLRLKDAQARFMMWVKERPRLQALLFIAGYHLCYYVVFKVYELFYNQIMSSASFHSESDAAATLTITRDQWYQWLASNEPRDDQSMSFAFAMVSALVCASFGVASYFCLGKYGFGFLTKY